MKDKRILLAVILTSVFLIITGITYAYFSLVVSGNDVAETINVSTTKIELIYTDGNEIKVDSIEPKWTTTKTITVENTGNEEAYYALGWQKLYNEIQKEELVIRSTCTSSGVTGGTCDNTDNVVIPQTAEVTRESGKILYPYKEAALILPGETHTYTVTIEFINYDDKAQNYNQGKKFYGVLGLVEAYNTYNLTLNVKNTDGTVIPNSKVTLHSTPMTGTTDENGTVIFNDVELGNHTLTVDNNDDITTTQIKLFDGENEIIKSEESYSVKPISKNIRLNVIVDNQKISNINLDYKLSDYIIDNYESLNVIKINQALTGNQNYETVNYRYQGVNPSNYITFNDEGNLWRIIGVFEVETPNEDGTYTKEYKVKIVRESLGKYYWNTVKSGTNYNDWTESTINKLLNDGPYYNKTKGLTAQACSTGASGEDACDYTNIGIKEESKQLISKTKWYLGNIIWNNGLDNTKNIYAQERSANVRDGNKQTWDGNVALMYPSDYMYASSSCYDGDIKGYDLNLSFPYSNDYRSDTCKTSNWLYETEFAQWSVSPSSDWHSNAISISFNSHIDRSQVRAYIAGIRPTLYLNSDIKYVSGSGKENNPFIIK